MVCVAEAPPIAVDPNFTDPYQPGFDFSGVYSSQTQKWMRYDCVTEKESKACSFVAPGVGLDGHGVKTKMIFTSGQRLSVPVTADPFQVDPSHPSGDLDAAFLSALRNNYQCVQGK